MNLPQYTLRKLHNLTHPVLGHILMLHRVVEQRSEGENRELEVTPAFLEEAVNSYLQQGYRFVSLEQVCRILEGKDRGKPFVCLTFDDGYLDTYTTAYPLLQRLGVPFAVYVTTGFVDRTARMWWYSQAEVMTWEHVKKLDRDPLCTIGAHTVSHPRLGTLSADEAREEVANSKHRLEELLGHRVDHFSYPHGDYTDDTLSLVRDLDFHSALRAWGGPVRKGVSPMELPRIELKMP